MIEFQTQWNFDPANWPGEINEEPSLTVPDQAYTVQELLEKFTSGGIPPVSLPGQYDDDPSFDDIDPTRLGDFDLADLTALQIELAEKKATLDAYIEAQKAEPKAEPKEVSGTE